MRNILVEIICRKCYYHTHIKSHTLVQPAMEPQLRKRILQERMFTYACPRCHEPITFIHNFLYHDVPHRFMVYMSTEERDLQDLREQFPDYMIRSVQTPSQLKEMIQMLEDGWDDRCLTFIQQKLKSKDPLVLDIHYHDKDDESETIWFMFQYEEEQILKAISFHVYDRFYQQLQKEGVQ